MTKITKKIVSLIFGAIAFVAFSFGLVFTMPQMKKAKADDVAVTFSAAYLEGSNGEITGYYQIRMDTQGQTWTNSQNRKTVDELSQSYSSIVDYTTINGRTLTEWQEACTSELPIIVTLQPAGTFSFMRIWLPLDFIQQDQIRSLGVLDGWAYNDGVANYTIAETTYLRAGDTMVLASNYAVENTEKLTSENENITIGDAVLAHRMYHDSNYTNRGADSYMVDINLGGYTCGEYDAMYNTYKYVRNAIYINGKSIDEWNSQKIAEDARFGDISSYTYFPQNSTTAGHQEVFAKPVGLWATSTGFRLSIYQELVADCATVEVTIGSGCWLDGKFMVAERVSRTVLTQNVVDITDMLTFLDNSVHNPADWGETKLYFIHTNNTACWTQAPKGGCLNEYDASNAGGGQIQMKYVTFNGSTLWDINKNDNGSYNSTQGNIANGGIYAPILVTMSSELGSSLKLTVPTAFTNGKEGHEEVVIKRGFNVKEGDTSYYVTRDVVFTNNGTTAWTKEIKAEEIATEVTGIITKANRTDGGNNEKFIILELSNNDYDSCSTTAIADFSSLYNYIDIGGTLFASKPTEAYYNVWNIQDTISFRVPDFEPADVQQIPYITVKAGAKFPSYNTQNGGALTYFVTQEDITFIHDVPNDTWTVGALSDVEYTVTFMVEDTVYHTETVNGGETVSAPTAPADAEDDTYTYAFKQWTLDGAAYDFNAAVTGNITLVAEFTATKKPSTVDITSGLKFTDQGSNLDGTSGNETYLISTSVLAWTNTGTGRLNKDYSNALDYIYFNGRSIAEINAESDDAYGSTFGTIVDNGDCAPIAVLYNKLSDTSSYLQIWVPTGYPNIGKTAEENHQSIEIKAGFSITQDDVTYKVTQDVKWVNLNNAWVNANETFFEASEVTIGNLRVDGEAQELYKVDITSDAWNITCNSFDFMYAGNYTTYRKFIFINGVSIYDINANTDDSEYVYSTSPMTGNDDTLFAHPVIIYTTTNTITLWMHKNYINSLDGKIVVTLGAGYSAYTNNAYLAENVDYTLKFKVEIDDGTETYETYMFQGLKTVASLGTPTKAMTSTTMYAFDGWYDANTDAKLSAETVITADMRIEARFIETTVNLIETDIETATFAVKDTTNEETGAITHDRWFYFTLTEHDYPVADDTYNFGVEYVKSLGIFEKIIIKGSISLAGTTVEEATLAEIGAANGYGEAVYMNIWNTNDYLGTVAFRVHGVETITEVIVEEGAFFPSYNYKSGAVTTETYYVLKKGFTALNNNEDGLHGMFVPETKADYDIQMAEGAGVRISSGNDYTTSGLRFETKISEVSVEELRTIAEDYAVTFGTLIVPKDYLMGGLFTHEWLDNNGLTYIDKESSAWLDDTGFEFPVYEDGYYSFFLSIVNLKEANLDREFVGLGYIAIDFDEGRTYIYASYDPTNARSASFVANAAINDRSDVKVEGEYDYATDNNNYSPYTKAELTFLENYITWSDSAISANTLGDLSVKGGTATIEPSVQKLAGPYVELVYTTNVNVWGVFTYTDGTKTVNEDFYLQAGTTHHKQFLDIFRYNGVGYGMDTSNLSMTSIKFTNAELADSNAPAGEVKILGLYSQNKTIETGNQEVYVTVAQEDGSEMTVGAHLGLGGALTYLAKSGIYEGRTSSFFGNVKISTSTSDLNGGYYGHATSSKPLDYAVNLINNWDAGRQIQQSWYAEVGGTDDEPVAGQNGYTRAFCTTESSSGKYWPYNPVQAGDVVSNPGQIIDYEVNEAKGYIYVKARAMDWAKGKGSDNLSGTVEGGVTTKSYMENYYRLNADGTVVVNNSFIDWNGFTDMDDCGWASTELPAVYPVHTLNYYVSNTDGDGSWTDGLEYNNGLGSWTNTSTSIRQNKDSATTKVEEWFAWANGGDGDAIGLGMYIPNVYSFTSGRTNTSIAYSTSANKNSSSNLLKSKGLMSNMQPIKYAYQGAYVSNTSYTAPGVQFRMEAYVPIEYSYVLCVNTVDNIRSTFKGIRDSGKVTNAGNSYEKVGLDAWARADKQWTW
ncbi:MAG: hypothetical protein IJX09_00725 [Clostridia bacterium]|nr:hypothetical protein [Clostridia bacterium]